MLAANVLITLAGAALHVQGLSLRYVLRRVHPPSSTPPLAPRPAAPIGPTPAFVPFHVSPPPPSPLTLSQRQITIAHRRFFAFRSGGCARPKGRHLLPTTWSENTITRKARRTSRVSHDTAFASGRSPSEKKWRDARGSMPYGISMVVCCLTPAEGSTVPSDTAGCARGCSSNWWGRGRARVRAGAERAAGAARSEARMKACTMPTAPRRHGDTAGSPNARVASVSGGRRRPAAPARVRQRGQRRRRASEQPGSGG